MYSKLLLIGVLQWWHFIGVRIFIFDHNFTIVLHHHNPLVWTLTRYVTPALTSKALNIMISSSRSVGFTLRFTVGVLNLMPKLTRVPCSSSPPTLCTRRTPQPPPPIFRPEIRQSLGISLYFLVLEHLLDPENPESTLVFFPCPRAVSVGCDSWAFLSHESPAENSRRPLSPCSFGSCWKILVMGVTLAHVDMFTDMIGLF
ncbi:hypothetical protein SLEP1_g12581 [Rubroshorea leprosula]|uniref:Uncharacterized protein n=1 Tax=Rubroshorea leprosula TaxID=152421 RepID=A0AAV5IN55_9ROSI|nr:hypothetical protein SLEP1_g12581 [Rubroshorea leprosula]